LGALVAAVAIAGCGSSSTKTQTVIISTSTVTASAPTTSSATTQASVTSSSTSANTSAAAPTPILITRGWSGVKPSTVDFSGDAGNVVTGLSWVWTATGATGNGVSGIQSCVPNCAQGATKQVPTTIVLSDPVNGHWTHLVETRNGSSTVDSYSSQETWPIGAQG
jgi:hypothetical protein